MEIEDKKVEEFEERFHIEDGVYMLTNTSFSQVPTNSVHMIDNTTLFFLSRSSMMIATLLWHSVPSGAFPVRGSPGPGQTSGTASPERTTR